MVEDVTLSLDTYNVFKRVPECWWNEDEVIASIALSVVSPKKPIAARLAYLSSVGLVERRNSPTITHEREIRRTEKV
jgi:hypothetical protein